MPPARTPAPIACAGAVLAGGEGRRIGGAKALVTVGGLTLVERAVATLRRVARPVAVVARPATDLPPGLTRWDEPDDGPRHPRAGLLHAIAIAGEQPVLVTAVDLPLLDPATLRVLLVAAALAPDAPAVVPRTAQGLEPLCALYRPHALAPLRSAAVDRRLKDVLLEDLGAAVVPFDDDTPFLNVNTPDDVARAERALSRR